MLPFLLSKCHVAIAIPRQTINLQLLRKYANEVTKKSTAGLHISADETSTSKDVVESVAVPAAATVTVDASLRSVLDSRPKTQLERRSKNVEKLERLDWLPSPRVEHGLISHYKKLSKFRLTSLVVITTMGGYAMAPAPFDPLTFALCSVGTGLVSAAANAINQYHEVPFDSQMSRTRNRVLVTGQVTPLHAVGFACTSATVGLSMLYFGVNPLTAALGAGNLLLYTSIYTPMKRMSILNTWVGSVVGAIPPLMGYAGCAGTLDAGAWIFAGLLYAWQFPHFNALSWNLRPDYSRAGYRMMAVTNPELCRRTALRYTIGLTALSVLAPAFDVTNMWFALETLPLNAYFTYLAYKFYKNSDSGSSRKLFRFSLVHLPALFLLFLLNKKHWIWKESAAESSEASQSILDKAKILLQHPTAKSLNNVLPVAVAATPQTTESGKEYDNVTSILVAKNTSA